MRTDGADRVDELDAAWVERPEPEADRTDEELETALLAYAHQRATRWGAERFAAEFERRDEEERRLTGTGAQPYRYPWEPDEVAAPPSSVLSGLVDAAVQEQVIRSDPAELDLAEPPKIRHAHVPRPAPPEPEARTSPASARAGRAGAPTPDLRGRSGTDVARGPASLRPRAAAYRRSAARMNRRSGINHITETAA